MMRTPGSIPSRKAGHATEKVTDFSDRGGMVTINLANAPERQCSSAWAIALWSQVADKVSPGCRVAKHLLRKLR